MITLLALARPTNRNVLRVVLVLLLFMAGASESSALQLRVGVSVGPKVWLNPPGQAGRDVGWNVGAELGIDLASAWAVSLGAERWQHSRGPGAGEWRMYALYAGGRRIWRTGGHRIAPFTGVRIGLGAYDVVAFTEPFSGLLVGLDAGVEYVLPGLLSLRVALVPMHARFQGWETGTLVGFELGAQLRV